MRQFYTCCLSVQWDLVIGRCLGNVDCGSGGEKVLRARGKVALRQTASTHVFRIPLSACASLVCIGEYGAVRPGDREGKWTTHNTGTRGSINARCCMLRNRSLNKLPSGCPRWAPRRKEQGHPSYHRKQADCTHLKPPQTLTKLLTELHVHLPLAHDVLAKFLSHQTPLREARFLLGTAFR